MDSWKVLFDDIKQCACINCKEKRAKTRALRNTIPQVKLIRYSSAIRDSLGTAGQIKSKPRAVPFKPSFDDNLLRRMLWSTVSKVALRSSNRRILTWCFFFFFFTEYRSLFSKVLFQCCDFFYKETAQLGISYYKPRDHESDWKQPFQWVKTQKTSCSGNRLALKDDIETAFL